MALVKTVAAAGLKAKPELGIQFGAGGDTQAAQLAAEGTRDVGWVNIPAPKSFSRHTGALVAARIFDPLCDLLQCHEAFAAGIGFQCEATFVAHKHGDIASIDAGIVERSHNVFAERME